MTNDIFPDTVYGQPVIFFDSLPSTNDYAKEKLSENDLGDSFVVVTGSQTQGKGRRGNQWYSEEGKDLTFTLAMRELSLPVEERFLITQVVSISIIDALQPYVSRGNFQIKWPNDIYFLGKKIGGILIENVIQGGMIESTIIGIGINLSQKTNPFEGISLIGIASVDFSADRIFTAISESAFRGLLDEQHFEREEVHRLYQDSLMGIGSNCEFQFEGGSYTGVFSGVNKNGEAMIVLDEDGQILRSENVENLRFV